MLKRGRAFLLRDRISEVSRQKNLYSSNGMEEASDYQLKAFNHVWEKCLIDVPFYQRWAKDYSLPKVVQDLEEIRQFPVLTKKVIIEHTREIFQQGALKDAYSTGGSSGEPTKFPRAAFEARDNYARTYAARGWWGVQPLDPYLHIWGHAHLFGGSMIHKTVRRLQDALSGAVRVNAYDLSDEGMMNHYRALIQQNPVTIIGYTSALFRLARFIEFNNLPIKSLTRLKGIIITSETVMDTDVELITRVFDVPLIVEYGSAETGTIATSFGSSFPLRVLWASNLVQLSAAGEIHVTTLAKRIFPLINYDIGDSGTAAVAKCGSVFELSNVTGRGREVIRVRSMNGSVLELSPILPVHILKSEPGITAVQFRQLENHLHIILIGYGDLPLDYISNLFATRIKIDHPDFDTQSVTFEQLPAPILSKAGKHLLFVP